MIDKKMNEKNVFIFNVIQHKDVIYMLFYTITIFLLYKLRLNSLVGIFSMTGIIIACFYKSSIAVAFYVISFMFIEQCSGTRMQIIAIIITLLNLFLKNKTMKKNDLLLIVLSFSLISISTMIGYKADTSTAIVMILTILAFVEVKAITNQEDISIIAFSFIISALNIGMTVLTEYFLSRNLALVHGRLNFGGDIKNLAIIEALALLLLIVPRMENKKCFKNSFHNVFFIFSIVIFILTIFLTSARGVIISVCFGLIIEYLMSKNKIKTIKYILIGILLFLVIYNFSETTDSKMFRIQRLFYFSEYSSGNGRTDIWKHYIDLIMNKGIKTIIFGVGPGNIARISNIGYYAHSTILDFFFSYGILGFILIMYLEVYIFKELIKSRINWLFSIFLAILFMHMTHGSSENTVFFIIQGFLLAISKMKNCIKNT